MATKGAKKTNVDAAEAFLQYEEEIATHPNYAGMPDLRYEDGSIQWETPSNRTSGMFKDSHDKRLQWWKNKAKEIGIDTTENQWISKTAKRIHPTGKRPCKVCGRIMEIRYAYLSQRFIARVEKLPFYNHDIELTEITHILDFLDSFVDIYNKQAYQELPGLLSCKQCDEIPNLPDNLSDWAEWIDKEYIPLEPSMLGPGAMANPPDRLDGFHTYNRCCRSKADKGRTKENLSSYSSDRRAFENWVEGNWITANHLMGYINSNALMKRLECANAYDGNLHPRPCSADHIGPISLGFCHRPEFQLLCTSCNSSKNNRMYYSDVLHLIECEKAGENVVTWYAKPVWDKCKNLVTDSSTALKLSRIMRDNRNVAMMLLYDFMEAGQYLFLLTLLHPEYANYGYAINDTTIQIKNQIVTVEFITRRSELKYVNMQKRRKIRVSFSSLQEYADKENRNGYMYTTPQIDEIKNECLNNLSKIEDRYKKLNDTLKSILSDGTPSDTALDSFLQTLNYSNISEYEVFNKSRRSLCDIMEIVGEHLFSNWNDDRYNRD